MINRLIRHRQKLALLGAGLLLATVAFVFVAKDDLRAEYLYYKVKAIRTGDKYESVVDKLGNGYEVEITDLPRKPSIHSIKHRNELPHSVPLVEGPKIMVWNLKGYQVFISFDETDSVLDVQVIDSASL